MATTQIMAVRKQIHRILDKLWATKGERKSIYKKLSEKLGYEYHTGNIRSYEEGMEIFKIVKSMTFEIGE